MRKISGNQAIAVIFCVNALTFSALAIDLHYLQRHRPPASDPADGFILRQQVAHSEHVYYTSARDEAVYDGLAGLNLVVFAASGGIVLLYARARRLTPR